MSAALAIVNLRFPFSYLLIDTGVIFAALANSADEIPFSFLISFIFSNLSPPFLYGNYYITNLVTCQ